MPCRYQVLWEGEQLPLRAVNAPVIGKRAVLPYNGGNSIPTGEGPLVRLRENSLKIVAVGLILTLLMQGRGPDAVTADGPQGNDRLGLCFISTAEALAGETRYDGALAAGAGWDRWPLYWHWVDEGGYVGAHDGSVPHDYDTLVIQEITHGLTPIAILLGTPDMRATAGSTSVPPPRVQDKFYLYQDQISALQGEVSAAASPPAGLYAPIFTDGTDDPGPGKVINQANSWADFVANTVQRYKPGGALATQQGWADGVGVRFWEIWNEPDLIQFWSGSAADFYRLLEVGYTTIKYHDPGATVILGGLAFFEKPAWLADLLDETGGDPDLAYFDVLSFHYYSNIYATEYWLWRTGNTLAANGLADVPIWITESGEPVWDDYPATLYSVPPDSPYRGTLEEQAAYVIQNAALAFYFDVDRYYHFMLHDDCGNAPPDAFGLRQNFAGAACNPAEGKRRPGYAAYQLIAELYHDLAPLWRQHTSSQDQIAFFRADDSSRVTALWATRGLTATATVSATGDSAQLYWIEPIPSGTSWGDTGITRTQTLTPSGGVYTLSLPPATNLNCGKSADEDHCIGGRPYLLVEQDMLPPTSAMASLPPTSTVPFDVSWSGEDLGSGIASYDVYISVGGGPLQPWITATTATSATYTGAYSNTYGFAIRARDNAGNEETLPAEPETITVVGPDEYPPTSSVEPLPPTSPATFTVRWSGEDLGSGIASYDLWMSDDGGPLQRWLTATAAISATFTGVVSHTYGFAVHARDLAGNEEAQPAAPQASTLVVAGLPVSGVVLGAEGQPVIGAIVSISGTASLEAVTGQGGVWSAVLPQGDYAFNASAAGFGAWPAPRRITVADATVVTLTLAPESNAVAYGDFEDSQVWSAWEPSNGDVDLSAEVFDGDAAARLGEGTGQPVTCFQNGQPGELWTLRQSLTVPSDPLPVLSFMVAVSAAQTSFDYAWLEVVLLADGQPHYLIPWGGLWQASDWRLKTEALAAWQGQQVDLLFQVVNCSGQSFTVGLDRVSVGDASFMLAERVYLPLVMR